MHVSGKGKGPRRGPKTRHQMVMAFPAWGAKNGTDVYLSSRWGRDWQIYDHFVTCKNIEVWWQSAPWDWIFIQEVPFSKTKDDFDWDNAKRPPASKELHKKRWEQKKQYHADGGTLVERRSRKKPQ